MRCLLCLSLSCWICLAQSITIGAIAGGRATDDVVAFHTPESNVISGVPPFRLESRLYDVGATLEVGLPHGLSLEGDALYHRQGYFYTFYTGSFFYETYGERDNTWELPLLLKYTLRRRTMNPFVEAGATARMIAGRTTAISQNDFAILGPPSIAAYQASYSPSAGFVVGAGPRFHVGSLRFAPQIRYTRWLTAPVWGADGARIGGTFSSNLNQVDLLVGIGWRLR